MSQDAPSKVELIAAGLGGMGVLIVGQVLTSAATRDYRYISYVPSYGTERRGGLVECTVILSHREIASPILSRAQTLLLMDSSQFKAFEPRVRPGGLVIAEEATLRDRPARTDISVIPVSGLKLAMAMGGMVVNNMIMLGVLTELVRPLPGDRIESELRKRYAASESKLQGNIQAFRRGIELGRSTAAQRC